MIRQNQKVGIELSPDLSGFTFVIPKGTKGVNILDSKEASSGQLKNITFYIHDLLKRTGIVTIDIQDLGGTLNPEAVVIRDDGIGTQIRPYQSFASMQSSKVSQPHQR